MTPEERVTHCRRIGQLGGQATYRTLGQTHMSAIGKRGFQAALDLGYGAYLLPKLAPTYRAKFGREPVVGRKRDGDAARAQARHATPTLGRCSWPACTVPATQRHHVDGWKSSPETCGFCAAHHAEFERQYRAAYTLHRPHARMQEPPTKRAVALSIGVGLDDAIPF